MQRIREWLEKLRKKSDAIGYTCDGCGAEVFEYPQKRLCNECVLSLQRNEKHRCPKCGRQTIIDGVCLLCKRHAPAFTRGVSPFVYQGNAASLINRIKNGNRRLAYYFGEEMAKTLMEEFPKLERYKVGRYALNEENAEKPILVLFVPATHKSQKERGYNQARDLAESVFACLKIQGYAVEIDADVLQKRKETPQQKHMHFHERMENVSGAYHVHKRAVCKDRTIVLVDDIMTTGATGDEIAKRLLGAGAKEVLFLVGTAMPESK
ncbi:MAG: ComF family protein [Clostridia bacterium]|nr:ComF family protein [Clostridia bacterium]